MPKVKTRTKVEPLDWTVTAYNEPPAGMPILRGDELTVTYGGEKFTFNALIVAKMMSELRKHKLNIYDVYKMVRELE